MHFHSHFDSYIIIYNNIIEIYKTQSNHVIYFHFVGQHNKIATTYVLIFRARLLKGLIAYPVDKATITIWI